MQSGTLDAAKVGGATLGSFIPTAKIFSLPYLFRDSDHYWTVLNVNWGRSCWMLWRRRAAVAPAEFRGLTHYDAGSRGLCATPFCARMIYVA